MSKKLLTAEEVRERLLAACAGDQKRWATEHNISGAYVSDVINGRREPGKSVLRPLHLEKRVVYEELP